jgi:hypothetical protein
MLLKASFAVALAGLTMVAASPAAACGPDALERGILARIGPAGALHMADGRAIRIAGMDNVRPELLPLRPGDAIAFGALAEADRWGRTPAIVFIVPADGEPVFLQSWLAGTGRALIRPEPALGPCWDLLRQAEASAATRPTLIDAPGRYARIEGRVLRIGEGRTARFIAVRTADGRMVSGLVTARNLAGLARAGVDLKVLTGHIVRLRGVRSLRNPRIIAVTRAEQIEIVR